MCEWGRVLQQLLATKHAIRDDKVSPLISTYLKVHSRACATWSDFYCVMDC
jgi:hypothetical protein